MDCAKQDCQHSGIGGKPGGFGDPVPAGGWPVPGNVGAEEEIVGTLELVWILELVGTELDTGSEYELAEAEWTPVVAGEQNVCIHW